MPKITIREVDTTERFNNTTVTNTVYIPGYANIGPINVPTLCESLEDFQTIFGAEPYKFRNDQDYPSDKFSTNAVSTEMGKFYYSGEFEKSYIVAQELLNSGIAVLYERVFNTDGYIQVASYMGSDVTYYILNGENYIEAVPQPNEDTHYSESNYYAKNTDGWSSRAYVLDEDDTTKEMIGIVSANPGVSSSLIKYKVIDVQYVYEYANAPTYQEDTTYYIRSETSPYTYTLANPQPNSTNFGNNTYYVLSKSLINEVSVQVKMDYGSDYGINAVAPITTVFTTDRQVAQQSSSIKLIRQGEPFVDNSGLVQLTLNEVEGTISTDTEFKSMIFGADASKDEFTVNDIYTVLDSTTTTGGYNRLSDKGEYDIKFITSGAYPTFEYNDNSIVNKMLSVASGRGDCTVLIDHTPNQNRSLTGSTSVYNAVVDANLANGIYGAMFTPWVVDDVISGGSQLLPPSFAYLSALAAQLKYTTDWLATAGVTRGHCNILSLQQNVTNAIADSYQPRNAVSINPITNIKPYGYTIWGARTLKNNALIQELSATSFLNIRQITNDVKRQANIVAKSLTFEQNTDILWVRFKGKLIPLLNQMVQGNAITSYEFVKLKSDKKATIKAIIRLYPIEPVEDWDITIELADDLTLTVEG